MTNTFHGYEQEDKFLFVRPSDIITIYQRGTEYILETPKHQYVVKNEGSTCLIDFTNPLVKLTGEYRGEEYTIQLNPDHIIGIELHDNDYHLTLSNEQSIVTPKAILERTENIKIAAL